MVSVSEESVLVATVESVATDAVVAVAGCADVEAVVATLLVSVTEEPVLAAVATVWSRAVILGDDAMVLWVRSMVAVVTGSEEALAVATPAGDE